MFIAVAISLAVGFVGWLIWRAVKGKQIKVHMVMYGLCIISGIFTIVFFMNMDIPTIAKEAGMSSSALHHHFKRVTTLSPIQFLKKVRLHQARLMLVQGMSASEAAFNVGYGSPSQFSREFRRLFGEPPSRMRVPAG